jgi:hypothetical protein
LDIVGSVTDAKYKPVMRFDPRMNDFTYRPAGGAELKGEDALIKYTLDRIAKKSEIKEKLVAHLNLKTKVQQLAFFGKDGVSGKLGEIVNKLYAGSVEVL